jgi:CheY-like chemotaxis protein
VSGTNLQSAPQSALVVDDDEFSREILRKNLLQLGIAEVSLANNGFEGGAVLDRLVNAPDFLICDIFMPDMDGIEFIAELSRRRYSGGLILVTGVNLDMLDVASDIATMNGLNMLGCFTKPLKRELLGRALGLTFPD